ncbi:transcription-associated protein 1 [Rhizoctonia solani]|uniref:Transcription-associated protein 1 n=1 Tax=Rhizoctonia solani TaxID=456999 RepID=A0A8H8NYP8_9AGAM|nr:transcription-associated protein 1 [Rhizoctonia solani]QRW21187.1 transcription-associated protein 1 [Rhizoctonia solani]
MKATNLPIQDRNPDERESLYQSLAMDMRKEDEAFSGQQERYSARTSSGDHRVPNNRVVWLRVLWPLLFHGVLTVTIAIFMLVYVNDRNFNISERKPTVQLHEGSLVPWEFYAPLQSDITTLLSISIAILRLVAAGWLGPLCWRCAFILMEKYGLRPQQLRRLISYNTVTIPRARATEGTRLTRWLIWVMLAITIPVQLSAPVLTGSITWLPAHHTPQRLSNLTIAIPTLNTGRFTTSRWFSRPENTNRLLRLAAGLTSLTWGRDTSTNTIRRYIPGLQLEVNSTITNTTLPYFSVKSIEWVNNPNATLSTEQLSADPAQPCRRLGIERKECEVRSPAGFLIPDPVVPYDPSSNLTDPKPLVISERRLMKKRIGSVNKGADGSPRCTYSNGTEVSIDNFRVDRPFFYGYTICYAYAWIDYVAGASTCYDCLVSSHRIVQNNSVLHVKEDFATTTALRLAPVVTGLIEEQEIIDVIPTWHSLDEQVIGMLTRAYVVSWVALTDRLAWDNLYNTTYSVSAPASQATVNVSRVCIWLVLQSLVTLSGVLFIYVQSRTRTLIITDMTLAVFYLDTSAIYGRNDHGEEETLPPRRVRLEGDCLRLKIE